MTTLRLSLLSVSLAAVMLGCSQSNSDNTPLVPEIESIVIEGTDTIHAITIDSDDAQLVGRINYSDGTSATTYNELNWESNDTSVLTVNNGLITPVGNGGTASVSASYRDKIYTTLDHNVTLIAINDINITSIDLNITSSATDINQTGSYALIANGTFSDNNTTLNISSNITWVSSNTSVVTIDTNGLLTVIGDGSSDVNVSVFNDINSTLKVNVGL